MDEECVATRTVGFEAVRRAVRTTPEWLGSLQGNCEPDNLLESRPDASP